jgi:isopropylmalate/homocitrate/citramalate synthase
LAGYEQQAQTAALRLSSEERRAIAQNLNAKEIAYIQAASANRPGETERLLKKYNDLKITDPAAAENMMKDLERIKTGSKPETAQQTLELKRQALMAKDESYKMAAIAYYNAKDPAKKQKAKDTMDAIEKAYGITGESTPDAGIGAPPPGAVKKIG